MKKLLFVLLAVCVCFAASGCLVHGNGSSIGYVTTVEDTSVVLGWDTVWFRVETGTFSSMQSRPEAYAIRSDYSELKEELLETCRKNEKIELLFRKHLWSMSNAASSRGEIIGYKVIEEAKILPDSSVRK